jgi:hypothetical protein
MVDLFGLVTFLVLTEQEYYSTIQPLEARPLIKDITNSNISVANILKRYIGYRKFQSSSTISVLQIATSMF